MTRVLVTGGAGFIGSHLVELLVRTGRTVRVVDDESTGSPHNLRTLRDEPRFEYLRGDLGDPAVLAAALDPLPERVFHLAAAVGVDLVAREPLRTISANIEPTRLLLEALSRRPVGHPVRVFLASSSEVYGKNPKPVWNEDDDLVWGPTTRMRWCYGAAKAIDEFLGLAHVRADGLPVVVGRFFNVVGPRQTGKYGMVLPRLVAAALAGEPFPIHGDGRQVRCFAHVLDVVETLPALLDEPSACGEVFNIGGDEPLSILDLSRQVAETLGVPHRVRMISYEEAYGPRFEDVHHRVPDLAKLRRTLGGGPRRSLAEAIREIAAEQTVARTAAAPAEPTVSPEEERRPTAADAPRRLG